MSRFRRHTRDVEDLCRADPEADFLAIAGSAALQAIQYAVSGNTTSHVQMIRALMRQLLPDMEAQAAAHPCARCSTHLKNLKDALACLDAGYVSNGRRDHISKALRACADRLEAP